MILKFVLCISTIVFCCLFCIHYKDSPHLNILNYPKLQLFCLSSNNPSSQLFPEMFLLRAYFNTQNHVTIHLGDVLIV